MNYVRTIAGCLIAAVALVLQVGFRPDATKEGLYFFIAWPIYAAAVGLAHLLAIIVLALAVAFNVRRHRIWSASIAAVILLADAIVLSWLLYGQPLSIAW